ncbi:hypothetical protein EV177_007449 [Coemansia sp. RSA 1804]|nr:hypothetical protein EV177_007449 [Coemansia sp. RSA 1804]
MSGDSSSEHWSFENLTHSTDSSAYPLASAASATDSPQKQHQQNPPLSLVLRSPYNTSAPAGRTSSTTVRSPSAGSIHATRLHRQQRGTSQRKYATPRPDSFSSETFSLNHSEHNSKQHLLYSQTSQNSMYATDNASGRQASKSPQMSASPSVQPTRMSMQSDQAVFVPSCQQPDSSVSPATRPLSGDDAQLSTSPSLPLPPAAAHVRVSDDGGRRRKPNSIVPLSGPRRSAAQGRSRSNSVRPGRNGSVSIALDRNGSASETPDDMTSAFFPRAASRRPVSQEQGRDDPLARKRYDLPATDGDAAGLPMQVADIPQQWQRVRIERDYSHGVTRQFSLAVPPQLGARVDELQVKRFVRKINRMLRDAENSTLRNVVEGCLAYATLYLSTLVIKPHFTKVLDRISRLVDSENKTVFRPAGLMVIDPRQTAFMFIEVLVVR